MVPDGQKSWTEGGTKGWMTPKLYPSNFVGDNNLGWGGARTQNIQYEMVKTFDSSSGINAVCCV